MLGTSTIRRLADGSDRVVARAIVLVVTLLAMSPIPSYGAPRDWDPLSASEDKTLSKWNDQIRKMPKNAWAYFERAKCYMIMCEDEKALADLSKAIELKPDELGLYRERSNLLAAHGRKEEAIRDCNKMIELEPTGTMGLERRAVIYQSQARLSEAMADLDRAIKIRSSEAPWQYKCSLYIEMKDDANALKCLSKLIQINPKNSTYFNVRSNYYVAQGKWDLALKDLSTGLAFAPDEPDVYIMRADVYLKAKRYNEAIKDYSHAIQLDEPRCGRAFFGRSQCEKALGDCVSAARDLQRSKYYDYEERNDVSKPTLKLNLK